MNTLSLGTVNSSEHNIIWESVELLPPKSAKTFDESLQILSPRKSLAVITPEFREKVRI